MGRFQIQRLVKGRDGPCTAYRRLQSAARLAYAFWNCCLISSILLLMVPALVQAVERIDFEFFYAKGVLAYSNRNYLEALDHLRKAVELAPENPDAQFYLGVALIRIGEYTDAVSALEKVLQVAPSKQFVHHHLGLAYFQTRQYDNALQHFEQALLFDPQKT